MSAVLEVEGLAKYFAVPRAHGGGQVHAVDGVDLTIGEGEIVGLVGESGSGKSTVGKCIMRLLEPTRGHVRFLGQDITRLTRRELRPLRQRMHMVFQDPYSSLDPRMTTGEIVAEPLRMHRIERKSARIDRLVAEMFERVGLGAAMRFRYPHELSGGQRQRVGLARSLILKPRLLVADEPISALDVSVQASIINLLLDLQRDMGFSCLFIAHDLAAVEFLCQRVAVMYLGRVVESGSREQIFANPRHPYTRALLSAALIPDPEAQRQRSRIVLQGDIPSPLDPPSGCHFHTRCPAARLPTCARDRPELREVARGGHLAACHFADADGDEQTAAALLAAG